MSDRIVCPKCLTEYFSEFKIEPNDHRVFKSNCQKCNTLIKFKRSSNSDGLLEQNSITFSINGKTISIENTFPLTMTLNQYLRDILNMTGTKVMCREGGCSSCLVNACFEDPVTKQTKNISINSKPRFSKCIFPLYSCDNMKFTTIEGIGNKAMGYNEIQKRLADYNGSQCGWCSTGMVMNMYSLLLNNPKPSKEHIEKSFDGNICRCTGYRSILDGMKSFASDQQPIDIEELSKLDCLNNRNLCKKSNNSTSKCVHIIRDDCEWYSPKTMSDLYKLLTEYATSTSYKLVSGNTGTGVFKNESDFNVFIHIKQIDELYNMVSTPTLLTLGSQISIAQMIQIMSEHVSMRGFEYFAELVTHLNKIANVAVRNMGSWSGNLMLKYFHNDFPSDLFVCFETVNATIKLAGPGEFDPVIQVTPMQLLSTSVQGRVIYSIDFQPFDTARTVIKTYKIMPRSQNAHAYVNAGFRFAIDPNTFKVTEMPSMVFGGISGTFVHATQTEQFLIGKPLNNEDVIQNAFKILSQELVPSNDPVLASPAYRRSLALSLFYKYLLHVNRANINPRYSSALQSLIDSRPVSSGTQSFPQDPSLYPVSKPMSKLNAYQQTAGEAAYVYDKQLSLNELHGAFILSSQANCKIDQIDTSAALSMPGVVRILFANDIPGVNSFMPTGAYPELLFSEGQIDYAGQAIGLVVAETFEQATRAAKAVQVTYKDVQKPILNVLDAIKAGSLFPKPVDDFVYGNAEEAVKNSPHIVQNNCFLDTQFHFYMENQVSVCEPTDDGFELHSSTQFVDFVQTVVAQVLAMPNKSKINVKVKQLGGGYGGKITRANITAAASALACKLLNRTVRVALDLSTSMEMIGKRFPWYAEYTVGFDDAGKIAGIILNWYCDSGNSPNDNSMAVGPLYVDNTYNIKNWHIVSNLAKTNLPANTACRSPGFFPSIAIMENIVDNVAKYLNADQIGIRKVNLYKRGDVTPTGQPLNYFDADVLIDNLILSSDYNNRMAQIDEFNRSNRWKKKGISLTPIKWGVGWTGGFYNCIISIYSSDGSVSLSHGGIEMGQGIHTKVAAVCAYELSIPIDSISVKHTNSLTNPNGQATGGSITSELACQAVIECCKLINAKLDPVRKQMPAKYTWQDLVAKAFSLGVDLCTHYWIFPETQNPFAYCVYGTAVSESICDVLTGETQILRTDILYDGGQTLNGTIDIGQAEGAFVMGIGFWLFEKVRYDPDTGRLLTNGTWEYKPPTSRDIPIDFRITFMDKNPNPLGVLGSKCIGEPPLCLTPSVAFSVKRAIEAARVEIDNHDIITLNSPATVEAIQQLCLVDFSQFKLN